MKVDTAFSGGNIVIEECTGNTLLLHQDLRDTEGDWFYFHFRIKDVAGNYIRVRFTESAPMSLMGPAVSYDDGQSWTWLHPKPTEVFDKFSCAVPSNVESIRFAVSVPYTTANLTAFMQSHREDLRLREETLCHSRKGRPVPMLRVGNGDAEAGILITCRHHACEMVGNFVIEGMIEQILGNHKDSDILRQCADWTFVPIVDMDGVEDGDQGKNRRPHDHNRDYGDWQIYPETAALKRWCKGWHSRQRIVLDLHCPFIRGEQNEHIFFSGGCHTWDEVLAFGEMINMRTPDGLRLNQNYNVPFGTKWNTKHANLLKNWAGALTGVRLSTALEIPYAVAGGEIMSPIAARIFGRRLAGALGDYVRGARVK